MEAAAHAERLADHVCLDLAACNAGRARAAVALHSGDPEEAAERALAAAALGDGVGVCVEAALARTLAGQALGAVGDVPAATRELERAAATLDGCGAVRYRNAADYELRKLVRALR